MLLVLRLESCPPLATTTAATTTHVAAARHPGTPSFSLPCPRSSSLSPSVRVSDCFLRLGGGETYL